MRTNVLIAALLIGFVVVAGITFRDSAGHDLAPIYIGCQLLAEGRGDLLYAHDPRAFHIVKDATWVSIASRVGYKEFLHPYVQIPLWAKSLQPIGTRISFPAFKHFFIVLSALAIAGMVFLTLRYLAPAAQTPAICAAMLAWLWIAEPFKECMTAVQTHPILLFSTLAALIGAERGRPRMAGILLAFAAAIKVTPALILIYWIVAGRRKAAGYFVISMAAIAGCSIALTGISTNVAYLLELKRISGVLLLGYNNQSLAAAVMTSRYPAWQLMNWRMLPLPGWLKAASFLLSCALIALAGYLRRKDIAEGACVSIALLAMTMFAPIAWTHYYVVLIVPFAWLIHYGISARQDWPLLVVPTAAFLCITFMCRAFILAPGLVRIVFAAGMISLVSCLFVSLRMLASDRRNVLQGECAAPNICRS